MTRAPDPVYQSSRKEMWIIFGVWAVFCIWVISYCNVHAYTDSLGEVPLAWGMPSWVFWGVAVPWFAASAVSIVFALFFMEDHPLEEIEPLPAKSLNGGSEKE